MLIGRGRSAFPIALIGLAVTVCGSAHAQTVTATQDYTLGTGAVTAVQAGPNNTTVNVLPSVSDASGNAILGHSYGSVGGAFGSRASGNGNFTNTGTFTEFLTYVNNGVLPVDLRLAFQIDAGALNVTLPLGATGTQSASLSALIVAGSSTLFDYESSINAIDPTANAQFSESGAVLNVAGPTLAAGTGSYSWASFFSTLDAGIVQPGQSLAIQYELISSATGTTGQTPQSCNNLLAAAVVIGPVTNNCASSLARIGDPSTLTGSSLTITAIAVPEPATAALFVAGLVALVAGQRRLSKTSTRSPSRS